MAHPSVSVFFWPEEGWAGLSSAITGGEDGEESGLGNGGSGALLGGGLMGWSSQANLACMTEAIIEISAIMANVLLCSISRRNLFIILLALATLSIEKKYFSLNVSGLGCQSF